FLGGEIKRIAQREGTTDTARRDELPQAGDGREAAAIYVGGGLETVESGQFDERRVDLPLQHGRACPCAAEAHPLAVEDGDRISLAAEVFGDQRTGNAAADDGDVGMEAFVQALPPWSGHAVSPRRIAGDEVVMGG